MAWSGEYTSTSLPGGKKRGFLQLTLLLGVFAGCDERAPTPPAGETLKKLEKIATNSVGMKLVLILPGEFVMGSAKSDPYASADEQPQHKVKITKSFYLGMYEVTCDEYMQVMGKDVERPLGDPQDPVSWVSWGDATEFCRRLSEREGRRYRLPTEAEWEYACRAGTNTRWCYGDSESNLKDYAWYEDNSGGEAHQVGQKKPNNWGLYDMHGNLLEWCADWYQEDYYRDSPPSDPPGPCFGEYRVLRGNSFVADGRYTRSAERIMDLPGAACGGIRGFRVAWTPEITQRK